MYIYIFSFWQENKEKQNFIYFDNYVEERMKITEKRYLVTVIISYIQNIYVENATVQNQY